MIIYIYRIDNIEMIYVIISYINITSGPIIEVLTAFKCVQIFFLIVNQKIIKLYYGNVIV